MVTDWLTEHDGARIVVEAPASSANLGAGYDCVGLALAMTDRIEVEVQAGPHRLVSLLTREAVDELQLEPGREVVCVVKATDVIVEVPS